MRVSIVTVGCRANQADSAWLGRALNPQQFQVVGRDDASDVCVVNSCAVTLAAERDVRRAIHRARRLGGEECRILLTGCMVTACADRVAALGPLWRVVPSMERGEIPAMLAEAAAGEAAEDRSFSVPDSLSRVRPNLRVQDGCRMKCAYCAVPAGRGPERSMLLSEVARRLEQLAREGAREVVICGINLGSWGHDLSPKQRLADLVAFLDAEAPVERIRFSSIEPWAVNDAVVDALAGSRRIAAHLHLPLQSGDNGVLRRMNRPYRVERFLRLMADLRQARPGLAVGTDLIAGFPGEDGAAFRRTLDLVSELPLAYVHAFGFSPRPGTAAADFPGQVESAVVKERVAALRAVGDARRRDFAAALVGEVVHPLFEGRRRGGLLRGISGRFVSVFSKGDDSLVNRIVPARVKDVMDDGHVAADLIKAR